MGMINFENINNIEELSKEIEAVSKKASVKKPNARDNAAEKTTNAKANAEGRTPGNKTANARQKSKELRKLQKIFKNIETDKKQTVEKLI